MNSHDRRTPRVSLSPLNVNCRASLVLTYYRCQSADFNERLCLSLGPACYVFPLSGESSRVAFSMLPPHQVVDLMSNLPPPRHGLANPANCSPSTVVVNYAANVQHDVVLGLKSRLRVDVLMREWLTHKQSW